LEFDFFTSGSVVAALAAAAALAGSVLAGVTGAAGAAAEVAAGVAAFTSAGLGSAAYAPVKPKQIANKETIRIVLVITFSKNFLNNSSKSPQCKWGEIRQTQ